MMPMRVVILPLAILLVGSTPVFAQPASQPAAGNESAARLILQLQQMREEIRELRGMVEAQAIEIENLARRQRDQYLDLDSRLSGQRAGTAAGIDAGQPDAGRPVPELSTGPAVRIERPQSVPQVATVAAPEVREAIDPEPEIVTLADPGDASARQLREPTAEEQQLYDQAFLALRETRYGDAAEGFDRFLDQYPDSSYAPNAQYWLGEVYYVTRDFETALGQFQSLLQRYPGSGKQPDALLKIGFSLYELREWGRARAALEQVAADFPGTNYARLAENRLRTMRLEGHL
ncbi:MAG: tol-pal system protein YbgF [Wenzhouxiangellaceae bacterium]|nr:tol-pal system protein YbgF [Wenzhouxiangellaceae bacterium]